MLLDLGTPKCSKPGCDNDAKEGSSSSKKNHSSMDSYDDGYNAVYEDDDYDWDRYRTDDEYAAGVDDAMEDEGEDW